MSSHSTNEGDETSVPFLFRPIVFILMIVGVVLFLVFTILTLGIFLSDPEQQQKTRSIGSTEEKLRVSLQRKTHRAVQVKRRINELQVIEQKILKTERKVFFFVRLLIGCLLVGANVLYFQATESWKNDNGLSDWVTVIADFNGCLLLFYSLPAYILYGTIGGFTSAMKRKTTQILRRRHIPTFSELKELRGEYKILLEDINYLKRRLEEFD